MKPLVPADVDLRGLPYMPLDVNRLRDSQLAISASGDEFRAAVLLWCASWNQVPAASLPDDDASLAAYAGYGRDIKEWRKVKSGAMRGFVQCDDDRFYHPVVAEKALEAWEARVEHREVNSSKNDRQKRWRESQKALCDKLREAGITPPKGASKAVLEELLVDANVEVVDKMETSTETSTVDAAEMPKKGREGKGREAKEEEREKPSAQLPLVEPAPDTRARRAVEIDTWLQSLGDADAIPATDPIFAYAQHTGIPLEFLELSWLRFVENMRSGRKRQKDWRAHYRNAVRGNWFKLWWFTPEGDCRLTTTGEQARRAAA